MDDVTKKEFDTYLAEMDHIQAHYPDEKLETIAQTWRLFVARMKVETAQNKLEELMDKMGVARGAMVVPSDMGHDPFGS